MISTVTSLVLAFQMSVLAATPFASSSTILSFQDIQNERNEIQKLWHEKSASEKEIKKGILRLEKLLATIKEERPILFALRSREINILADLAAAYAKLADLETSLEHLNKIVDIQYFPELKDYLETDSDFKLVRHHEAFQNFLEQLGELTNFAKATPIAGPYEVNLSLEQKIAGLSLFWSHARQYFVYFDQVPKLKWDEQYQATIKEVLKSTSTKEYYAILIRFSALLNDSHTQIYPPEQLFDSFYSRPPISTRIFGSKVLVDKIYYGKLLGKLEVGDEIVSINGLPSKQYAAKHIAPFVSSSTPQDKEIRVYHYQLLNGEEGTTMNLELLDSNNIRRQVAVKRKRLETIKRENRSEFRMIDDLAYLKIANFSSDEGRVLFEKNLKNIQLSASMIIDLRENGGGSTDISFLRYIIPKPFLSMASNYRLSSGESTVDFSYLSDWSTPNFATISPHPSINYNKPIVLLIGPKTFSAAEDFVAIFKQSKRGILIGEKTAGSTGQPFFFPMPGGGSARICIKKDSFVNGEEFVGIGIEPDYRVSQSIQSLRKGEDDVLQFAIKFLKKP